MYPYLVLLNQLAIFFATWLVIKSSIYRNLLQFQGIIVPRSNGLFGFISPNSFLFWNHSSRRHCLKNHCCWYVISKIIFLIQISHKNRCSLPHIIIKNIYIFIRIDLQILLRIIVLYVIAVTMHYFLGKSIAPLDCISQTACRTFRRPCSPGWFFSDSMSSLEILEVSQLPFFSKPNVDCEECSFFWQSSHSRVKQSFLLRSFHIRQKENSNPCYKFFALICFWLPQSSC